jgi:hypothetical protein
VVDQLGDGVREPVEAVLELRPVEREEDVEDVLRGVGVPDREEGLDQVDSGRGPVAQGVVARGDQVDDLGNVPGGAQVARDGDKDVGPVACDGEDLLVDGQGPLQVLLVQLLARREEPGATPVTEGSRGPGGVAGCPFAGSEEAGLPANRSKNPMTPS